MKFQNHKFTGFKVGIFRIRPIVSLCGCNVYEEIRSNKLDPVETRILLLVQGNKCIFKTCLI